MSEESCLCVFDIDRTLTSKQGLQDLENLKAILFASKIADIQMLKTESAQDTCQGSRSSNGIRDTAYGGGVVNLELFVWDTPIDELHTNAHDKLSGGSLVLSQLAASGVLVCQTSFNYHSLNLFELHIFCTPWRTT